VEGGLFCPKCGQDQNSVVETGYQPEKATTGRLVAMWIFAALGGAIGIILSAIVIGAKNPDRTPKYMKTDRTQGIIALVLAICSMIFFLALNSGY
jgi:hypothetical protein